MLSADTRKMNQNDLPAEKIKAIKTSSYTAFVTKFKKKVPSPKVRFLDTDTSVISEEADKRAKAMSAQSTYRKQLEGGLSWL